MNNVGPQTHVKLHVTCSPVLPHGLAIAAGLHDDGVGDREEEEQEDLEERGDSDVGDQSEGAGHAGQQGNRVKELMSVVSDSVCRASMSRPMYLLTRDPGEFCTAVAEKEVLIFSDAFRMALRCQTPRSRPDESVPRPRSSRALTLSGVPIPMCGEVMTLEKGISALNIFRQCISCTSSVTSFDQTSYCHFLRPRTPHSTRPVCRPTRMFRSTSVASTTDLHMGAEGRVEQDFSSPVTPYTKLRITSERAVELLRTQEFDVCKAGIKTAAPQKGSVVVPVEEEEKEEEEETARAG
ncbi:hypothetical protein EYF80_029890 [Liparis tanakae]|uniref:Uncharacterized protein n=1 Tax=Liparis tanakae TaxID=230148 RepID=A0A4Z2H521_9TELE|nr:hypothetical protein EYF80_029890 [Liparis tanakae]